MNEAEIEIQLNGESYRLVPNTTIPDLLARLQLTEQRVAIELNLEIVPRTNWGTTSIKAGDQLEIVHFVGGG